MDPFEIRMQFLTLISRLSSSLQSLSKVSSFALKHSSKCSDDIWDCLLDELTHSPSLNHRCNILYLVDLILDKEGPAKVVLDKGGVGGVVGKGSYRALIERDLGKVVDQVVPKESKQGVLNYMSAMQVIKSWKTRRLLDSDTLEQVITELQDRKNVLHEKDEGGAPSSDATTFTDFSRNDILRRIEDDRERHKRLRERIWVLPIPSTIFQLPLLLNPNNSSLTTNTNPKPSPISPASPFEPLAQQVNRLNSTMEVDVNGQPIANGTAGGPGGGGGGGGGPELALEIEFDQLWETSKEEQERALKLLGTSQEEADGSSEGRRKRRKVWELDEGEKREMRVEREKCFHV